METESRSTPQHTDVPDAALFWRWAGRAGRPVVGWVLIGVGALAILVGYFGLADRVLVAEQLPYLISGGIGGMAFVVVGGVLLATQDVRRDAERLDQFEAALSVLQEKVDDLHRVLLHRPDEPDVQSPLAAVEHEAASDDGDAVGNGAGADGRRGRRVYVVGRGTTFHAPDCGVLRGKSGVTTLAPSSARKQGLTPCLLCDPS